MADLDGMYVIGDGEKVHTEEDIGEPWRVEAYQSLDYAKAEADKLNDQTARFALSDDDLEAARPYRVYQLTEVP